MLSTELMKQQVIPLFLSPKGRISRGLFWKSNLVLWLGFMALIFFVMILMEVFKLSDNFQDNGFSFAFLLYFYAAFVLTIKRLHDINWAGWLAVPCILTGLLWLVIGLVGGISGKNKYGDNPIEYEKNRLYINRGTGLPPPPPPLHNPISKIFLYVMMISFLPSLVVYGMVMPDKVEKPALEQAEEVDSSKKEAVPVLEEPKEEALPFDLKKGDQYQKVEAKDGIAAYYVVTRVDGTIEHYALDGTLQWSNVEHEEEESDVSVSAQNFAQKTVADPDASPTKLEVNNTAPTYPTAKTPPPKNTVNQLNDTRPVHSSGDSINSLSDTRPIHASDNTINPLNDTRPIHASDNTINPLNDTRPIH